jgi:hypothetical protein
MLTCHLGAVRWRQRQTMQQNCTTLLTCSLWGGAQATAQDFATKLYTTPEVSKSARFSKPKMSQTAFTIDHYAGQVSYKTDSFLAKNKDFVVAEHQALMQNSSQAYMRALFPPDPEDAGGQVRLPGGISWGLLPLR